MIYFQVNINKYKKITWNKETCMFNIGDNTISYGSVWVYIHV